MARIDSELWALVEQGGLRGSIDERITRAATELRSTRDELVGMQTQLRDATKVVGTEITRVDRLLRLAGVPLPKPRKPRPSMVPEVLLERVRVTLAEQEEEMTVAALAAATEAHPTVVGRAVSVLRERGVVRAVGSRATPGGNQVKAYRLFEGGSGNGNSG